MWNPLVDVEEEERARNEANQTGFWHTMKKYKSFIYIFITIFVIYIFVILYYESNERWMDKNIDCNILNEECKDFQYVDFNSDKLSVVDVNLENNNFIMRSNVPLFNGQLSEEKLLLEIKKKIEEANLNYYDNYTLHIFSLLKDNDVERCYIASEKCYAQNAIIKSQPIYGSSTDPYDFSGKELETKLKNLSWNTDDLLNKTKELHDKFTKMKNVIFLIHCRIGKDRTGEYVGAYRMFAKRNSLKTVLDANEEYGKLKANFIKMQKWFCLYLERVLKYKELNCFNVKLDED